MRGTAIRNHATTLAAHSKHRGVLLKMLMPGPPTAARESGPGESAGTRIALTPRGTEGAGEAKPTSPLGRSGKQGSVTGGSRSASYFNAAGKWSTRKCNCRRWKKEELLKRLARPRTPAGWEPPTVPMSQHEGRKTPRIHRAALGASSNFRAQGQGQRHGGEAASRLGQQQHNSLQRLKNNKQNPFPSAFKFHPQHYKCYLKNYFSSIL